MPQKDIALAPATMSKRDRRRFAMVQSGMEQSKRPGGSKSKALEVLQRLRAELRQGTFTSYEDPSFRKWVENAKGSARNLFGEASQEALDFSRVGYSPIAYFRGQPQEDYDIALKEGIDRAGSFSMRGFSTSRTSGRKTPPCSLRVHWTS
jgi:hypothetical protein